MLGVWAHPDDETYLSSGLMARAVRAGNRVVCVTATRGEGGSMDEDRWPSATLAAVREQELMRCMEILGVTEHHFLGLPDVDWHTPLPEHGAELVEEFVRTVRPDTVLTFGPEGMTGHVGHQSVHRWTTDAFHAAAPPGSRLFYAVHEQERAVAFKDRLHELGAMRGDAQLPMHPRASIELAYDLEPDMLELKLAAIAMHESQTEGMVAAFGADVFRTGMSGEFFRLAAEKPGEGSTN